MNDVIDIDFSDFVSFADWLESEGADVVFEKTVRKTASLWMDTSAKLSPVGETSMLRKSWHRTEPHKKGDSYEALVYNAAVSDNGTPYPLYVNYGHRSRNGGWVEGQFFFEDAEMESLKRIEKIFDMEVLNWWNEYRKR